MEAAAAESPISIEIDPARRQALIFEVVAVAGWMLLPHIASVLYPAQITGRRYDPLGLAVLGSIVHALGSLGLLAYIIWNSGDEWAEFGICKPRWSDVPIALAGGAGIFLVVTLPSHVAAHGSLGHFFFPKLDNGYAIAYQFYLVASVTLVSAAFLGLILTRLLELCARPGYAIALVALCYAIWYGASSGARSIVSGVIIGCVFGSIFVLRRSLWPIVLGYLFMDAILQCYG